MPASVQRGSKVRVELVGVLGWSLRTLYGADTVGVAGALGKNVVSFVLGLLMEWDEVWVCHQATELKRAREPCNPYRVAVSLRDPTVDDPAQLTQLTIPCA